MVRILRKEMIVMAGGTVIGSPTTVFARATRVVARATRVFPRAAGVAARATEVLARASRVVARATRVIPCAARAVARATEGLARARTPPARVTREAEHPARIQRGAFQPSVTGGRAFQPATAVVPTRGLVSLGAGKPPPLVCSVPTALRGQDRGGSDHGHPELWPCHPPPATGGGHLQGHPPTLVSIRSSVTRYGGRCAHIYLPTASDPHLGTPYSWTSSLHTPFPSFQCTVPIQRYHQRPRHERAAGFPLSQYYRPVCLYCLAYPYLPGHT